MYHRSAPSAIPIPSFSSDNSNNDDAHFNNSRTYGDDDDLSSEPPQSAELTPKVHIQDIATPSTPYFAHARQRSISAYKQKSPSERQHQSHHVHSSSNQSRTWISKSNVLMLVLGVIITTLLFFQSPTTTKPASASQVQFLNTFDGDPWGEECPDYKDYSGRRHAPYSSGPLKLPFQRPVPECRSFVSKEVERVISEVTDLLVDRDLARLFENCYPSTLDTTVRWHIDKGDEDIEGPQSFIVTGDINAEWLRDSTNQLSGYIPLVGKDKKLRNLILGAIKTQADYVIESPYCNAFQPPRGSHIRPSDNGQGDTVHPIYDHNTVFECKYEIDSLANFLSLANQYYEHSKDYSFVDETFSNAVESVFNLLEEQAQPTFNNGGHELYPFYSFQRNTNIGTETLALSGRGNPLNANTSLVRSAFRPSDDACILQYFIPGNAHMSVELKRIAKLLEKAGHGDQAERANAWGDRIRRGVLEHGIVEHSVFGKVFAYEVDGYGSRILMDDANLPSLLSLPKLGFVDVEDAAIYEVYLNTRKMVLSAEGNPYFLSGVKIKGIGGPHIGLRHVWPMSILMQAMTSDDDEEIMGAFEAVKKVSWLGLINESVHVDRPGDFTRSWFAWANAVYAQTILDIAMRKPYLLFGKKDAKPYKIV